MKNEEKASNLLTKSIILFLLGFLLNFFGKNVFGPFVYLFFLFYLAGFITLIYAKKKYPKHKGISVFLTVIIILIIFLTVMIILVGNANWGINF